MTLREAIISLAQADGHDVGIGAMIVAGEWSYCVAATIYIKKSRVQKMLLAQRVLKR